MTEEEAKTKWCPMVRFSGGELNVIDRIAQQKVMNNRSKAIDIGTTVGAVSTCIGSACMAWRWRTIEITGADMPPYKFAQSDKEGFCGLAGSS